MANTQLVARADRVIAVALVDVGEPTKELYLLDSAYASVGVVQQLYLLASHNAEVTPVPQEVVLLDSREQYVGTEVTGVYLLAKHDATIEPVGIPEEVPEEAPPAKANWWLWGGIAAIAVVLAVVITRRGI